MQSATAKDNPTKTLTPAKDLKSSAGEIGWATLKINTNIHPDSACGRVTKPCPNNTDLMFKLTSTQDFTTYYDGKIRGSPDTIILKVPVAKEDKTDYAFFFDGPGTIPNEAAGYGYWGVGSTSVLRCDGQLSNGEVASCTVGIHYGYYG